MKIAPTGVRIPPDIKQNLVSQAKQNSRSLNKEIVYRLKESLSKENAPGGESPEALSAVVRNS